ncbi:MAG: protein kinase [Thermoanaerobaculia bacterium]
MDFRGRIVSHYAIEARLGAGGMGEVFLARDIALERPAALKLLPAGFGPELRVRLVREAEACAHLQHPAIATFYEAGEADGTTFLAMEYVHGETLRMRLHGGPIAGEDALAIAGCLLEALAHAHAAGVLHRDLKPENVMLTGARSAKLLDFGLAKEISGASAEADATATALTGVGGVVGTAGYMSPEQLRGDPVDARSDIFQLGALLYEALTGERAFPGATATERLANTLSRDPDWSRVARPDVPAGLRAVLTRALAREPALRYGSAAELLSELQRIHEGRLVVDLPDTVAVLDLQNLTGDPADDWLGSGIAETLGAELSRVEGLTVIARERVLKARSALGSSGGAADALDVGLSLGCRWAFSGSFQKVGPHLRITTRLTEVPTVRIVSAEKLDGTLESVFEMQDRLAGSVAGALNVVRPQAAAAPVGESRLEVFENYARGRRLWLRLEKGSFEKAREHYQTAIGLDPGHAPALAGLAGVHGMRFTFTTDPRELSLALQYADQALAIDPENAEALVWRGYALLRQERFDEGVACEVRAMGLDPTNLYPPYFAGATLMFAGRLDEAVSYLRRAAEIGSKAAITWLALGCCYLQLGELPEARSSLERAVAMERTGAGEHSFPGTAGFLAECLRRQGELVAARARALEGLEAIERSDHMYRDTLRATCLLAIGRTALDQEDRGAATAAFRQALLQLRGRPQALGSGHLAVQALAGLALAGGGPAPLEEARNLFRGRSGFDFHGFYGCSDEVTGAQLAAAERALGGRG